MVKINYGFEKRRKEMEKKRRKEEKLKAKAASKSAGLSDASSKPKEEDLPEGVIRERAPSDEPSKPG